MTFALFCLHAVVLVLILPSNDCAAVIHDGGWALKFLAVFATFIGFFWVPISFFAVWADISRWVGLLFLLLQVLYILAGAYAANEWMIETGDGQ